MADEAHMHILAGLLLCLASGATCAQPASHGAAVAFWTAGYAGADLAEAGCPAPVLPALAHVQGPVRAVRKAIGEWEACHAAHLARLRDTPPETRIPTAVLALMSADERARAHAHVGAVQARAMAAAQADGAALAARHASWLGARVQRFGPVRGH